MAALRLRPVGVALLGSLAIASPSLAEPDLFLAYPPSDHETTAERIFLIGTADPDQPVQVNGEPIEYRSRSGHFAPSVPLQLGENVLTLTQGEDRLTVVVTRLPATPTVPPDLGFVPASLTPSVDWQRPAGERVCFSALAIPGAEISVSWGGQAIALAPQPEAVALPPNQAVLTGQNQPLPLVAARHYEGCTTVPATGSLGRPTYRLRLHGETTTQTAPGAIERLPETPFQVATVTAASGVARTGPATDYSRLTPLPQGTRAVVTAITGDWLRLDYGGWIRAAETQVSSTPAPPQATLRSITSEQIPGWTEIRWPLSAPVPISLTQTADTLTLTLHNTVPQTDTIYLDRDPVIRRLDWHPVLPDQAHYRFQVHTQQQWGYKVRYEGTTLVLALRHPPVLRDNSLAGSTILLDPGHGSENDLGARGPTGYPEKDVTLVVSQRLRDELEARGATVVMTRTGDEDLYPSDRVAIINAVEPTLALSIHYNALPDAGDALNTAGIGSFWYHAQAHDLAAFLQRHLVRDLNRPNYGVYWNNLALTRPTVAPSVLLELGFMINPDEFEWITDPEAQADLAASLADGIARWLQTATR